MKNSIHRPPLTREQITAGQERRKKVQSDEVTPKPGDFIHTGDGVMQEILTPDDVARNLKDLANSKRA